MTQQSQLPQFPPRNELAKPPSTPMDLLTIALQNNAAIDVIERLAALQEKALNRDAEQQFNEAMNAVQQEVGRIAPDLVNKQTSSKYASYAALDRKIRPLYTKHGFSLSFDTADPPKEEIVRALCYVSHRAGHTRRYQVDMPADGKGAKGGDVMTKTHASGAAMAYGMRYLLKYIFNLAIGEDDTDGNLDSLDDHLVTIANSTTLEDLHTAYKDAYRAAKDSRAIEAMRQIVAAKDQRKKELQ